MLKSKKILFFPFILCLFLFFHTSCKKEEIKRIIKVTTDDVSQIATKSATLNGTIVDIGEGIIEHGFCWSTTNNPTIELSFKTQLGSRSTTGSFNSNLTGLSPGTTYYVRAYVTNSIGTAYGNEISFATSAILPTLTTSSASDITYNSATSGGNITDDGGATVTARGVCWSTSQSSTISDNFTTDGSETGSFSSSITGLSPVTTYYVRAYATNSVGTAYGNQVSFTTPASGSTVTDYDGNVYQTITIGVQTWMAENLKTTKYNDGTAIPLVTDLTTWSNLPTPGYCWYNNDQATYKATYGALYNWYTVNTLKLCPTGWHVPTDDEWKELEMFLGMSQSEADATSWHGTDEGGKLKETGTAHWISPNTGATNESGFTALPGGYRYYGGTFYKVGGGGYWWSSTEYSTTNAWSRYMSSYSSNVNRGYNSKKIGFSVRCVRD